MDSQILYLFQNQNTNRGVGGLNTDEFLEYIHILLLDLEPSRIFINIGTNDITEKDFGDQWFDHLMDNYLNP